MTTTRKPTYEPRATRQPRAHVYRVRFDDGEMATLQALAAKRGVTLAVALRGLVRRAGERLR